MSPSVRLRAAGAVAAVGAAAALAAAPAFAHAPIKTLTPKSGATASTSLRYVRASFKEGIVSAALSVKRGSTTVSTGSPAFNERRTALRERLRSGLTAGRYAAHLRWVSDDGHVQTKTWSFRLR